MIRDVKEHLDLLEETIRHQFIPAIAGGKQCSNDERVFLSLTERYGRLGIPIFHIIASFEYENSSKITSTLGNLIKDQNTQYSIDQVGISNIKSTIKTQREICYKEILEDLRSKMSLKQKRLNNVTQEQGASNWLTTHPLTEYGFDLNKQQFCDSIRIRCGWDIKNMPTTCSCGAKLDYQYCMSCKKGGFITIRHNDVRDLTANILKGVLNDVEVELQLLPVTGDNPTISNCDKR